MLPVDAQTTALAPSSTAMEIAIVMPRSLKLPVGFGTLDLQPHLGVHTLGQSRRRHQGRAALEERHHRRALG